MSTALCKRHDIILIENGNHEYILQTLFTIFTEILARAYTFMIRFEFASQIWFAYSK